MKEVCENSVWFNIDIENRVCSWTRYKCIGASAWRKRLYLNARHLREEKENQKPQNVHLFGE